MQREKATNVLWDPVPPTAEHGHSVHWSGVPMGIEPLPHQPPQSQFICEGTCW